ncbi:MAG: hypothetical protein E7286_02095 [Lachnospiraceae bacterium]|nr:hypothetical protein [Lachnospiraceae bacterium]
MEYTSLPTIAFLIVAHTKPQQLNLFVKQLLAYEGSYVYIHVDAKNRQMEDQILQDDRVVILPEHFDIKWGDYSQIQANDYLLQYAMNCRHHDYYSLHSGVDLAVRPVREYARFLAATNLYGYYGCSKLPNHWQYGGGLARVALNWPVCFRRRVTKHSPIRYLRGMYGRMYETGILKGRKLPEQYPLYGGCDWFTVREDCVRDVLTFLEVHPDFKEMFVHSLSGGEIYYVTLFELTKKERPVCSGNHLRFIDHRERGRKREVGSPNICTMDMLGVIERSQLFFARKFDEDVDAEIIAYYVKKCGG